MNRRRFLARLAAAAPAAALNPWRARGSSAESRRGGRSVAPAVRAVTRGPKFHWRGYYDKLLFDPTNRFLLANEVDFEGRSPAADDVIKIGMIDLEDGDRWIELGTSRAWNWQQGCMLQWRPESREEIVWNDREGDRFVSHVLNPMTGRRRTLPHPIYALSPDGRWALFPDFRRLNDTRPGYGYAGLPDPRGDIAVPADDGVWRMDMDTGAVELLWTLADAAAIPYEGGFSANAQHWFNHLLFSPDGSRFVVLHRWRGDREGGGFATRMFTLGRDGKDPYVLDPYGRTSHFIWRDARHIMAWAWHPSHQERFYVYRDRTDAVEVVGPDVMTRNGHNTYVPGTDLQWVLNDTYPDRARKQEVYLYHVPTNQRFTLGRFDSPLAYTGEWRCDTHPCASRDGRWVAFDSPHLGTGRQVHLIDISQITG